MEIETFGKLLRKSHRCGGTLSVETHRCGDIVLCEGSLYVLVGDCSLSGESDEEHLDCHICWLVPPPSLPFPPTFGRATAEDLVVLDAWAHTLASCPEDLSPAEHREWVEQTCNIIRKAGKIHLSLRKALRSNLTVI